MFEEKTEEERPTKQWLKKKGKSSILEARKGEFDNCKCQTDSK